jgi:hypothetical protein
VIKILEPTSLIPFKPKAYKLAFIVAMLVSTYSVSQETPKPLTPQTIPMDTKKQQVLDFLSRLKIALDLNVIGDPLRLQEITGFEVLEWNTMLTNPHYRTANRWRYNVPAMDQAPDMLSVTDLYRTGYRAADNSPHPGGLGIGGFPTVACISPGDIDQIFGHARLISQMKPKPFHDRAFTAPFWDVNAYILNPKNGSLLTLSYNYEDESKPQATCLAQLGVSYGLKPPIGY